MPKTYREVDRILMKAGWRQIRIKGSHERWEHPDGRQVTLAGGGKRGRQVPVGTLSNLRVATRLEELR